MFAGNLLGDREDAVSRFLTLAEACLTCSTYERMPQIQCPVLVMGSGKDKVVTPEATIEIAERLRCEPVLYEEYGHSAYEEAPDFSNRVMTFFLNTEKI